jgi:hypothetical protein
MKTPNLATFERRGKGPLADARRTWNDNDKMDLKERMVAQDRDVW